MLRVFKRYADAIVLTPGKTIIVEAKIRLNPGVISYLDLYARLFKETLEFKERWNLPIEKMLVFAIEDPVTIELARQNGIRAVPFQPPWIRDYLKLLTPRERRGVQKSALGEV